METRVNKVIDGELPPPDFAKHLIECKADYSVTRVSYITGFSRVDLPVAIAYRPNSKLLSQSGGKGISKCQSLISALMESYECDAAENIQPDLKNTSYNELLGSSSKCIDPKSLPTTLSDYTSASRMDWSMCKDLITNEDVLVPFDAVTLDFTRMSSLRTKCFMQLTSNGLASGQTVDSATISALLEIVERHCVTTRELNYTAEESEINLETLPERIRVGLLAKFKRASVRPRLYNVSLYTEFPVYACTIIDESGQANIGWGCHLDHDVAVARAITEANQARTIQISGSREDMHRYDYMMVNELDNASGLDTGAKRSTTDYRDYACERPYDLTVTMNTLINQWSRCGLPNPLIKVLACDDRKAAVRAVAPMLHGYNYPAYKSILRSEYTEQVSDYKSHVTHRPAAI
jgi:ribosomal protein S12 methylthiotransferase accessory factor